MDVEIGIEDELIAISGAGLVLIYIFLWRSNSPALQDLAIIYSVFCVIGIIVGLIIHHKKNQRKI
jgi:uncharacterized membrane protein